VTTATITMRPYAGEADMQLIVDLVNACEAVDRVEDGTSIEELRSEFTSPRFDAARNLRLWEDAEGRLAGYAEMWFNDKAADPDGLLWFKVHPDARGGDLDAQIIAWGTGRVREAERELGKRLRLRSVTREILAERIAMLEQHGFSPDRYFLRMVRPLNEPIPEPKLPEGFTVVAGDHDAETWVALYNESFVDHWNFSPMTVED
jgi:mycothiol synthase